MTRVPRLQTARLLLRAWQAEDLAPFAAMCADPDVMRWSGEGRSLDRAESSATMDAMRRSWDTHGYGPFAVEDRESGEFCGFCGLSSLPRPLVAGPAVEMVWRLGQGFQNLDFAHEATQRILRFAYEDLHLERLVSTCHASNLAAQRVLKQSGMQLWLAARDPSSQRRVRVFMLRRTDWLSWTPAVHHAVEAREYFFEEGCFILELLNDPDHPQASIARARVPTGSTTRWHHLEGIAEHYVVTEGLGRVEVGNDPPREVRPGDVVRIPPGVRQRIASIGLGDLVFLAVCVPRFSIEHYRSR